jgi:hypothetical protein
MHLFSEHSLPMRLGSNLLSTSSPKRFQSRRCLASESQFLDQGILWLGRPFLPCGESADGVTRRAIRSVHSAGKIAELFVPVEERVDRIEGLYVERLQRSGRFNSGGSRSNISINRLGRSASRIRTRPPCAGSRCGGASSSLVKCLTTIECKNPYNSVGKGCVWTEEFMAKDLGEEDIVGLVFGFELVATDGAVG